MKSKILGSTIYKVVDGIQYSIKDGFGNLRPEDTELQLIGKKKSRLGKEKYIISRSGMPQGLSISPVLCIMVLGYLSPPLNLYMYADDGILLSKPTEVGFIRWRERLEAIGIAMVPEKSRIVEDGVFSFVGINWKLKER